MLLHKTFAHHTPTPDGLDRIARLRIGMSWMMELIIQVCPESRERACALTRLDEVAMWANKAVACNDPNAVVDTNPERLIIDRITAPKPPAVDKPEFDGAGGLG